MSREACPTKPPRERVIVCGVLFPDQEEEHDGELSEIRGLAVAAGVDIVGEGITQRRQRPDSSTLLGKGKVEELELEVRRYEPDAVLVDNDLTPAQMRNLEKVLGKRIVDRSELILDIFSSRAQTKQARLQVELAQVEYLLPRLRRMWTHLERQVGGIGTRGPGETQLETDRRLLLKRVTDLKVQLREIERRKRRQVRSRADQFTVGLVGYTNAGKTTLLNRLTGAEELSADMLFATLDTRTRQWKLDDGRVVLLSDTVGFLQRLPHHLVASFHATLEEALNVDLLLHVADASHPDASVQMAAVNHVLATLGGHRGADVLVLNKVDAVPDPLRLQAMLADWDGESVFVSAKTGEGIDRLQSLLTRRLDARSARVRVRIPVIDGRSIALVRRTGLIEAEECGDEFLTIDARIADHALGNLRRGVGDGVTFEMLEPPLEPFVAVDPDEAVLPDGVLDD